MKRGSVLIVGLGAALLGVGFALHANAGDAVRVTRLHTPTLGPPNATQFSGKKVRGGKRPQGRPR